MAQRLRFRVPASCPSCEVPGQVTLERTVRGEVVNVNWCCHACSHEWPPSDNDKIDRRKPLADRRGVARKDRRTS